MDAIPASAENYADRHQRILRALRVGEIADSERLLFLLLLDDLPSVLAATPLLFDASWCGGRCDLLFTDGAGTWCAVEVKNAPTIDGTGQQRKNEKRTWSRRYDRLVEQTVFASLVGARIVGGPLRGLGLWREDGAWRVVADLVGSERLRDCA